MCLFVLHHPCCICIDANVQLKIMSNSISIKQMLSWGNLIRSKLLIVEGHLYVARKNREKCPTFSVHNLYYNHPSVNGFWAPHQKKLDKIMEIDYMVILLAWHLFYIEVTRYAHWFFINCPLERKEDNLLSFLKKLHVMARISPEH